MSVVGYLYNRDRVLCQRSCSVRCGKSEERIGPIYAASVVSLMKLVN